MSVRATCIPERWAMVVVVCVLLLGACSPGEPARELGELVVEDSTYYSPDTMQPYSGRVFRPFPADPTGVELEGTLLDGTWHGELVVYHPSGRIRYRGSFSRGQKCGPWTENSDDRPPVNLYDELVSEIESLGIYPPCPPGS